MNFTISRDFFARLRVERFFLWKLGPKNGAGSFKTIENVFSV